VLTHARSNETHTGAWTLDSGTATFALSVAHRSGPIRVGGTIELLDVRLDSDASGHPRLRLAIDTGSARLRSNTRDPFSRAHRVFSLRRRGLARFESSQVTRMDADRLHVVGLLDVGGSRKRTEVTFRVRERSGELEVEATAAADHRRLGFSWIPAGPLKARTEVTLRARLRPAAGPERKVLANSRYHFMGGRRAPALRKAASPA
jgi:polyisoprenoid-binding protein YceI